MSNVSAKNQEAVETMEAIIKVLKKEFPDEASTLVRDIVRVQISLD